MRPAQIQSGDFVLVPHGVSGQQVAVVVSVEGATVTIRKFVSMSRRFTAPATIPLRRVTRAPDDDKRVIAARQALEAQRADG